MPESAVLHTTSNPTTYAAKPNSHLALLISQLVYFLKSCSDKPAWKVYLSRGQQYWHEPGWVATLGAEGQQLFKAEATAQLCFPVITARLVNASVRDPAAMEAKGHTNRKLNPSDRELTEIFCIDNN